MRNKYVDICDFVKSERKKEMRKWNLGKLLLALGMVVLLAGCDDGSYERDTTAGEVIQITLSDMETMMENKESFAIMLTQTTCGYCKDFHNVLAEYQNDHHLVMYEVVLDQEPTTVQENVEIINKHITGFSTTPGIFYIEKGKSKGQLKGDITNGITEDALEEWVVKYKLDSAE